MSVPPLQGVRAALAAWNGFPGGQPHYHDQLVDGRRVQPGNGAAGGRTEARTGGEPGRWYRFDHQGRSGYVSMKAGPTPGVVHVTVRLDPPLAEGPDAFAPHLAMEADVSSTWIHTITSGASTQNEQARRIAEALRDATRGGSDVPGAADLPASLFVDPPIIRGPLRHEPPFVWLPAEYPPPPDDPALVAELR